MILVAKTVIYFSCWKLVKYKLYLGNTVGADGLVLQHQGICSCSCGGKFMKEWRSERSGPSRGRSAMCCYSCNGLVHMQRDCTEGPSCFGCGEKGHMMADCPKPD